jgi:BASS family bile acid:Na+ symporter
MRVGAIIESSSLSMIASLSLGLAVGGFPYFTKEISMAALAVLMTLSLSTVSITGVRGRDQAAHAAKALVLNYVLLTGVILLLGLFFSDELWPGWVLMAAAPSAVSVVPFTTMLGGRTTSALYSTAVIYLAALIVMPLMCIALIGSSVSVSGLVTSLLLLIALPMAISRPVSKLRLDKRVNTILMNISFAVVIFAVTGANRDAFFGQPELVLAISLACFIRTFGVGIAAEYSLRFAGLQKTDRISYVLFASYKNLALTATLAIALFEPVAAVPATICIVFEILLVIFLLRWYPHVDERPTSTMTSSS